MNVVPPTKDIPIDKCRYWCHMNSPEMMMMRHGLPTQVFTTFEGLKATLELLNQDLTKNPIPGQWLMFFVSKTLRFSKVVWL